MKAFLDISVGDLQNYKELESHYNRFERFFNENASQYGYGGVDINKLTQDDKDSLKDIFSSQPENKGQPVQVDPPNSLHAGRITIELFDDCPKTVENFQALITGEKGATKKKPLKQLHFKGNTFHRIINNFMAQGGDVTHGDGSGGESIFKGGKFNDEKNGLKRKFTEKGLVGMANSGKNSNTSQFFITLAAPLPKLDGNYVCFGKVIDGLEVLDKINAVGTAEGNPTQTVTITDCGLIK